MLTTDTSGRYDVLEDVECRELLGRTGVGRLAFTEEALPAIRPVAYVVHDDAVVFRVGRPMARRLRGSVVAFEMDSCAAGVRGWWLVTAIGHTRLVAIPGDVAALDPFPDAGSMGSDDCVVTVGLELLRGWRTVPGAGCAGCTPE